MNLETSDNARLALGQQLVEDFLWQFDGDEDYRSLACHAALPLVLTPELLKFLCHEFLPHLSWAAEVDLLLSRLCAEAADDLKAKEYEELVKLAQLTGKMLADRSGQFVGQLQATGELSQNFQLPGIVVQLPAALLVQRIRGSSVPRVRPAAECSLFRRICSRLPPRRRI